MKRIMTLVLALAMLMTMCAFASAEGYTIGYSLKTITNDDFQLALYNAVKGAVEASGNTFVEAIAETQTGVATQVTQIEDLINSGVDALILNPMDSNACISVMEKAKEAGIPVVLIDQGIEAGHEDLYITFISTDNFAAAEKAGQFMAEKLGGEGKVIIVRGANRFLRGRRSRGRLQGRHRGHGPRARERAARRLDRGRCDAGHREHAAGRPGHQRHLLLLRQHGRGHPAGARQQ